MFYKTGNATKYFFIYIIIILNNINSSCCCSLVSNVFSDMHLSLSLFMLSLFYIFPTFSMVSLLFPWLIQDINPFFHFFGTAAPTRHIFRISVNRKLSVLSFGFILCCVVAVQYNDTLVLFSCSVILRWVWGLEWWLVWREGKRSDIKKKKIDRTSRERERERERKRQSAKRTTNKEERKNQGVAERRLTPNYHHCCNNDQTHNIPFHSHNIPMFLFYIRKIFFSNFDVHHHHHLIFVNNLI